MALRIDGNQLSGARQDTFPLTWSAYEILQTGVAIKEKSDVWSFGILMWEIFYLGGALPYADIAGLPELKNHLETGQRLEKPPLCPQSLYELMLWCWAHSHQSRPTFSEIKSELTQFQSNQSVAQINSSQEYSVPQYETGAPPKSFTDEVMLTTMKY